MHSSVLVSALPRGLVTVNADVARNEFSVECNGATHNADNRDDLTSSLYFDNKWWMRLTLSHPPESRRLLVAGSVRRIIGGFNFREALHARGMNFGDPVLEPGALDVIFNLAIPQSAFKSD